MRSQSHHLHQASSQQEIKAIKQLMQIHTCPDLMSHIRWTGDSEKSRSPGSTQLLAREVWGTHSCQSGYIPKPQRIIKKHMACVALDTSQVWFTGLRWLRYTIQLRQDWGHGKEESHMIWLVFRKLYLGMEFYGCIQMLSLIYGFNYYFGDPRSQYIQNIEFCLVLLFNHDVLSNGQMYVQNYF